MSSFIFNLYNDQILSLKRGNNGNTKSNAKPLFLLSIIESLSFGELHENQIRLDDKCLEGHYDDYNKYFEAKNNSPMIVPYYHMHTASFYHLIWLKEEGIPMQIHTPSAKYLRENLLYAKLDDKLWDLLQVPKYRETIRKNIINRYFNH